MTKDEQYRLESLRGFRKGWQRQGSDLVMKDRIELERLGAMADTTLPHPTRVPPVLLTPS